ncbi:hypothetical protein BCR44DRAFT_1444222 [Catenaria anguillulae PL171]|uniref:Uncharacterized protein n=2 Tax=Catenaria anguillulae PL171 TaxID=765915 RepID=A0A1Y2H7T4_9FUNG|nr:hypothetical protein BCR44DRAFT_1444222 [Catenaria anguillulae PL171]
MHNVKPLNLSNQTMNDRQSHTADCATSHCMPLPAASLLSTAPATIEWILHSSMITNVVL